MLDVDRFRSQLVDSGKINPERLAEAETYATDKGVSLSEALASNLVLGFADRPGAMFFRAHRPALCSANAKTPIRGRVATH